MIPFRRKYAPGFHPYSKGYNEIRWDVVGCNLKCQFCWSPASRPKETRDPQVSMSVEDVIDETKELIDTGSIESTNTFIRFTGGEPTLYWDEIVRISNAFENDARINGMPILIQTNGINIGAGEASVDELVSIRTQRYLFELSFKGTNREEFSVLTGKEPELFKFQLDAYEKLRNLSKKNKNINVVAVLGVYHSSVKGKSKYAFINPHNGTLMFDNPDLWDDRFLKSWQSARFKWVESLRMSPLGVWENLYRRCGPQGSGILRHFPDSIDTNRLRLFPMKPRTCDYAGLLLDGRFWGLV